MVLQIFTGYNTESHYLKQGEPFEHLTKSGSDVNKVTYPYLVYIHIFFACCLEQYNILRHYNLQFIKQIYLTAYVYVN